MTNCQTVTEAFCVKLLQVSNEDIEAARYCALSLGNSPPHKSEIATVKLIKLWYELLEDPSFYPEKVKKLF